MDVTQLFGCFRCNRAQGTAHAESCPEAVAAIKARVARDPWSSDPDRTTRRATFDPFDEVDRYWR